MPEDPFINDSFGFIAKVTHSGISAGKGRCRFRMPNTILKILPLCVALAIIDIRYKNACLGCFLIETVVYRARKKAF